ncbi:MAG TPA: type I-E CRISPR-associated protein Cse2/CasB [Lachnospiraceae bacterium]
MEENKINISSVAWKMIHYLEAMNDTSLGKGILADLRNSIGKPFNEAYSVWPYLFELMPKEFLGVGEKISAEENALFLTLQIYALGQQGDKTKIEEADGSFSMGDSFHLLRARVDNKTALDQRFNTLITSTNFEEFAYHLRQMVKLMKSKSTFKINYGHLAKDLFYYQIGNEKTVKVNWARKYY